MKELDEANEALAELLSQYDKQLKEFCWNGESHPSISELRENIFNLKGDGWRMAIVSSRFAETLYPNTKDEKRLRQVIWQAGE